MTILARVVQPGFELTVCGTPSKQWLDWLLTAEVPLTADQLAWREIHRRTIEGQRPDEPDAAEAAPRPRKRPRGRAPFDLVDTDEL